MFLARLFHWSHWRRRGPCLDHLHVVLYTRQGCHLCEVAEQQLEAARRRYRVVVEIVDIDGQPELVERYGSLVPVVTIQGKVRFRGAINSVLLSRLLRAEAVKVRTP